MGTPWVLGETKYIYTVVSSSSGTPTISSATYEIYDTSDESVVASGTASIQDQTIYCLWEPEEAGLYNAVFDYTVGLETFKASQIITVRETM